MAETKRSVPVAFDVIGTMFDFRSLKEPLMAQFESVKDETARAIVDDLFHSSQRDFTYLSMNGGYTPIATVIKTSLPRVLLMNGIKPPNSSHFTEEDLSPITTKLSSLPNRPGLLEATKQLLSGDEDNEYILLAATNGAEASTKNLLSQLGDEADKWSVLSCDSIKVAKPDPSVYEAVWEAFGIKQQKDRHGYFVASHAWDLYAARKAGFITVWVSYEEFDPTPSLWGTPDIIASDLQDAARKIIIHSETFTRS